MDYYKLLGIDKTASTQEIKKAYRRLVLKWHPDKNSSPKAQDMFMKITKAYDVLSDPVARSRYDRSGRTYSKSKVSGQNTSQRTQYTEARNAYEEWLNTIKKQKQRSARAQQRNSQTDNHIFTKSDAKDLKIHGIGCLITLVVMCGGFGLIVFLDTQFNWFPGVIFYMLAFFGFLPASGALFYSVLDYLRKKL